MHAFRQTTFLRRILSLVVLATMLMPGFALAQDRILTAGDTIRLEIENRPELEQLLTLDDAGRVDLPQVGEVTLAGLSVADAETTLHRRLRIFDPELDTVRVTLTDSHPLTIQVQGAVVAPGPYPFDGSPGVWDLIQLAGGVLDTADLSVARVVREENGIARILPMDLSSLVAGGRIPEFSFMDGDVLVIPLTESGTAQVIASSGVQVFGAVAEPSVVPMTTPRPLLDVLMLAGSPLAQAELQKIWLVHPINGRFDSRLIDLSLFMEKGNPLGNPLIFPGDALQISFREDNWFRRNGPLLLGTMTATATLWLAYDRVSN